MDEQKHEMALERIHPSGTEEWYCATCGRRFLLSWPPEYQKIILNAGDEYAVHSGGKGGLSIDPLRVGDSQERELPGQIRAALEKIVEKFDHEDNSGSSGSE
ncbi:MAG TPA: hypothetical protein VI524_13955 [Anaerolineales bacterium]|nr:hypothetical protein [Anaerolineales bacterium]